MALNVKNNFLAISDILLMTTMLGTNFNEQLEKDAYLVVSFIGHAFGLKDEDIARIQNLISDELTVLSTTEDIKVYRVNQGEKDFPKISDYLYLKMQAILRIDQLASYLPDEKTYFECAYLRNYYPAIRYKELELAATRGNVDVNRATAIMQALGIGVEKSIDSAIYRLKQCAYWGDTLALYYLSYLYKERNDEDNAKLFANLSALGKYLLEGRTVLPKSIKDKYDQKTIENYAIISSVKQDVVLANNRNNIDYSFIEVILMDNLDYYSKIDCINKYKQQTWKEITNSSNNPEKKIGFRIKGDK